MQLFIQSCYNTGMTKYELKPRTIDIWTMFGIYSLFVLVPGIVALDSSSNTATKLAAIPMIIVAGYGLIGTIKKSRPRVVKDGDFLRLDGQQVDLSKLTSVQAQWGARTKFRIWRSSDSLLTLTDSNNKAIEIPLTGYNFVNTKRLVKDIQEYRKRANIVLDDYTSQTLNSFFQ